LADRHTGSVGALLDMQEEIAARIAGSGAIDDAWRAIGPNRQFGGHHRPLAAALAEKGGGEAAGVRFLSAGSARGAGLGH